MKKTLLSFLTIAAVALQANAADLPTTGNVIAEYYTGNGQTFGGWGGSSKFENVDEDGKPCLKFTNEEATESGRGYNFCISGKGELCRLRKFDKL